MSDASPLLYVIVIVLAMVTGIAVNVINRRKKK